MDEVEVRPLETQELRIQVQHSGRLWDIRVRYQNDGTIVGGKVSEGPAERIIDTTAVPRERKFLTTKNLLRDMERSDAAR